MSKSSTRSDFLERMNKLKGGLETGKYYKELYYTNYKYLFIHFLECLNRIYPQEVLCFAGHHVVT